jgi:diguanylate cyclase (GGDEF)-like protein
MLFPQIEELATTGIVSVREDAPVSTALQQMARCKLHTIVVEEASGGFGLLTAPDLVRLRFALPSLDIAIRDVGYHRLSCIEKGKNILDVLDAFENGHGYAAVVDGSGTLFGIVSNTDILGSLDPQLMLQRQCLRDLLHRHKIKQASHDALLGDVLANLVELDDAVIVVKAGKRVGIVTNYDAIRLLQNEVSLNDPVARHMSSPLHTVSVDLTVGEALATLRELHFKRLVVEDSSGEVVGIITQNDLVGVAYSRWADLMRHHEQELREIIGMLERKTARLEQIAATDPLTGAANRARFEERLLAEHRRHDRAPGIPFSVLLLDIDRFKQINDTWGHLQGDLVLKGIVQLVQSQLRNIDTLARWGGEEFALLLPQTGAAEARAVAEKTHHALAQAEFGKVGRVTASFGVATCQAGESGAALLERADDALYRAKRNGRNRVEVS